ncbi:MAG: NAD(P)/FAD-dependent oxidoreductase [Gemmataceae bacterium]|nr:NAD(P)/FAD-dependent oxidoreductase [Gemmataceae bacterium]
MTPERQFDVLVVGAGPAGLAAACCAAESGRRVGVVDDNPDLGGQIWRGERVHPHHKEAGAWLQRVRTASLDFLPGMQVIGQNGPGRLLAETADGACELRFERLILAPGARERFLPFPGWTLPGVLGAGGLQAMVKGGLPIEGRRVVVAGSGPLLLAVAAYLRTRGAKASLIAEQAAWSALLPFGLALLRTQPDKTRQALALRWALRGVPYRTDCWPMRADGDGKLASVTLTNGRRTWSVPCDYLACGFGLVPNLELPLLMGCDVRAGFVAVDEMQQTSVNGVYGAGEVTGIGGLDKSLTEGQIAGYAATGQPAKARRLVAARKRSQRFAATLNTAFALRDELRHVAAPDTLVCRCEDVSYDRVRRHESWRAAKLQTRCGMGPCQGRVCGAATEFLFGWPTTSVRPPIYPTALANFLESPANPASLA